jgi:hypothetical protein
MTEERTIAEHVESKLRATGILETHAVVKISLLGREVTLRDKNPIGDMLQSWVSDWLVSEGYPPREGNSQEFPDFYLTGSKKKDLLELKCFDATSAPNFDIANFDAYCSSLETKPYRLDASYLILSYELDAATGNISIRNIWLKKIWEISTSSGKYPIRLQVKKGIAYNLRPATFTSKRNFNAFKTKEQFILALYLAIKEFHGEIRAKNWYRNFSSSLGNDILSLQI